MSLNDDLKSDPLAFAQKHCIKVGDVAGGHSAEDRRDVTGTNTQKCSTATRFPT